MQRCSRLYKSVIIIIRKCIVPGIDIYGHLQNALSSSSARERLNSSHPPGALTLELAWRRLPRQLGRRKFPLGIQVEAEARAPAPARFIAAPHGLTAASSICYCLSFISLSLGIALGFVDTVQLTLLRLYSFSARSASLLSWRALFSSCCSATICGDMGRFAGAVAWSAGFRAVVGGAEDEAVL